jgi:hypothetical protein
VKIWALSLPKFQKNLVGDMLVCAGIVAAVAMVIVVGAHPKTT